MDDKHNRSYFRLEYPKEARPSIEFAKGEYPVINLCEKGVKFCYNTRHLGDHMDLEADVNATIVFQDRSRMKVSGKILRIDSDALVMVLTEGVSLQKIMTEQRFLLNKFGNLKRPFEH